MIDQLLGLVLLGLGIQSPMTPPMVKGDSTEQSQSGSSDSSGNSGANEEEDTTEESESSGTSRSTDASESHAENEARNTSSGSPKMIDGIPSNISAERRAMYKKEMERRKSEFDTKRKSLDAQYKAKRELLQTDLAVSKKNFRLKNATPPGELFRKHTQEEKDAFIASMKAKMEQSKSENESKVATLKEKINTFKDEFKKTKVEDIQNKITSFVTKRIGILTQNITKMTDIVALNTSQVAEKAGDKDTSAFDAAAAAALAAINSAKDKISELSTKQYVVAVQSESTVKTDVENVRKNTASDIKAVQELMKNARVAVSKMITERAKLLGEPIPDAVIK